MYVSRDLDDQPVHQTKWSGSGTVPIGLVLRVLKAYHPIIGLDNLPTTDCSPPRFLGGGSSGCLGGKLVIAQDAAQSLTDLCMQCFWFSCSVIGGWHTHTQDKKFNISVAGMVRYDTYWLGRLQPHSLDSLVAYLPRGSLGAQPFGVTRPNRKKKEGGRYQHLQTDTAMWATPHSIVYTRWGVAYLDFFRFRYGK